MGMDRIELIQLYDSSDEVMRICIIATLYAEVECKEKVTPAAILFDSSMEGIVNALDHVQITIAEKASDGLDAEKLKEMGKIAEVLRLTFDAMWERKGGIAG